MSTLRSARFYQAFMSRCSMLVRYLTFFIFFLFITPGFPLWLLAAFVLFESFHYVFNHVKFGGDLQYTVVAVGMMVCSGILKYELGIFGSVFAFLTLSCITVHRVRRMSTYLFVIHIVLYFLPYVSTFFVYRFTWNTLLTLLFDLFLYIQQYVLLRTARDLWFQKKENEHMVIQLEEKNAEVIEYMHDAQQMSRLQERNSIAQRLHDSLGHLFMALNMNADVATRLFDQDSERTRQLLAVMQDIIRTGISELSNTVSKLKQDEVPQFSLRKSIEDMLFAPTYLGQIETSFDMDESVEQVPAQIKNVIYGIVRENFTNSVKHGHSEEFSVQITRDVDLITVVSRDNGLGCDAIQKSHGLRGIDAKLAALHGSAVFQSGKNQGFSCVATIPYREESI